jgi:hypothetical protein
MVQIIINHLANVLFLQIQQIIILTMLIMVLKVIYRINNNLRGLKEDLLGLNNRINVYLYLIELGNYLEWNRLLIYFLIEL